MAQIILVSSEMTKNSRLEFCIRLCNLWLNLILWMFSKRTISTGWVFSCSDDGAGVFQREIMSEKAKDIHWSSRIIVSEKAVEVNCFYALSDATKVW